MDIFECLKMIIETKFKETYIKFNITKLFEQANKIVVLDNIFCVVLFYLRLKIFLKYNKVNK